MRPPLSYVPLLPVLSALIAGTLIGCQHITLYWAILPLIAGIVLYRYGQHATAIAVTALSIGWINADIRTPKPLPPIISECDSQYTATVIQSSESETSRHLTVDIDNIGKCRLTLPTVFPEIKPGDIVSFTATLTPPENRHDLPDEWDMEAFMRRQGIVATSYVKPEDISVTGFSSNPMWHLRQLQSSISSLLGKSSLCDSTTAFLIATITGEDALLQPDTRQDYTTAGLAHILALSGLHVGMIALIINIILFPLYITRQRNTRVYITITLLWGYAMMTGLSPSVTRATIMVTLFLMGTILQRRHSSMNALCFAAIAIILFSPLSIHSAGFHLSFAAVAAILLFTPHLNPVSPRHRIAHFLMSTVSVSIAAMLGTGLIAAYYFHSFPLYFLIGNILVMLLLSTLIGGGVLLILIEASGHDPQWLCSALDIIHSMIEGIVRFSNSIPGASVTGIYFPAWLLIPGFISIALLLCALIYRRAFYAATTAISIIVTIILFNNARTDFPRYEYFIPRDSYYTNIIVRDSTAMYLFTTAPESEHEAVTDRTNTRYRDYMGRRSVSSLTLVTDTFDSHIITRRRRHIAIGNRHFVIVDSDNDTMPSPVSPDYALVCRGFRGDIQSIIRNIHPDTLLLSRDLHPSRTRNYMRQAESLGTQLRVIPLQSRAGTRPRVAGHN